MTKPVQNSARTAAQIEPSIKFALRALMLLALVFTIGGLITLLLNYLGTKIDFDPISNTIFIICGFIFGIIAYSVENHLKKDLNNKK